MTPQRCSEHAWITITWLEDDGRRHSHDVFCQRCAERVTVTAAGARPSADSTDRAQPTNFLNTQGEKIVSSEVLAFALNELIPADAELSGMTGKKVRGTVRCLCSRSIANPLFRLLITDKSKAGAKDEDADQAEGRGSIR